MYTIEDFVRILGVNEGKIREWLSDIGESLDEGTYYSDDVLERLRAKSIELPRTPTQISEPQKDDDGPDFCI